MVPHARRLSAPAAPPRIRGQVALAIDGAPCRSRFADDAMVREVLAVLKEFDAHATFFVSTDYVRGYEDLMREAIAQGHEVANRCPEDRSYAQDSEAEFEAELLRAETVCSTLRAPLVDLDMKDAASLGMSETSTMVSEADGVMATTRMSERFAGLAKAEEAMLAPRRVASTGLGSGGSARPAGSSAP